MRKRKGAASPPTGAFGQAVKPPGWRGPLEVRPRNPGGKGMFIPMPTTWSDQDYETAVEWRMEQKKRFYPDTRMAGHDFVSAEADATRVRRKRGARKARYGA